MTRNFVTICFLLLFSIGIRAQGSDARAKALLDKASVAMTQSGGVDATFTMETLDGRGVSSQAGQCRLRYKGTKFCFTSAPMQMWCDGKTLWNYVVQNREIYVNDASVGDEDVWHPAILFRLYKRGYSCKLVEEKGGSATIKMTPPAGSKDNIASITLSINTASNMPRSIRIAYSNTNGQDTRLTLASFKSHQTFDDKLFVCIPSQFKDVEVVDMR